MSAKSERGECTFLSSTEELASLKYRKERQLYDDELASLKYRKDDMVQGSVNLVTLKKVESYLKENCLHNNQLDQRQNVQLHSDRNQSELLSSAEPMIEHHIIFGNFNQNDRRFSDQTRGFQCTCNALCMLSHNTYCTEINSCSSLDKILYEGDILYQEVTNTCRLKAQLKFIHPLLSLDELPTDFEITTGKFDAEKDPIVSGFLVDTQESFGLPTLHNALQASLSDMKSCLLTIGGVCSAVFKRNDLYMVFDSHSHGENGLSSVDGISILISFFKFK